MNLASPVSRASRVAEFARGEPESPRQHKRRAGRQSIVRIELVLCHLDLDVCQLGETSEETPDILGIALTQVLRRAFHLKRALILDNYLNISA